MQIHNFNSSTFHICIIYNLAATSKPCTTHKFSSKFLPPTYIWFYYTSNMYVSRVLWWMQVISAAMIKNSFTEHWEHGACNLRLISTAFLASYASHPPEFYSFPSTTSSLTLLALSSMGCHFQMCLSCVLFHYYTSPITITLRKSW